MNSQRSEVRGQRSEPRSQLSTSNPQHSIEVHIEELVLHGFAPGERWRVADALESELRGLLAERGVPTAWLSNPERIDAGAIGAARLTRSAVTGAEIAGAAYRGGAQ